jgi:hypothetical protein
MGRSLAAKLLTLMALGTAVGELAGKFPETKYIFNSNS